MPIGGNVDIRMELPFEIASNRRRSVLYRATVLRVEEASEGEVRDRGPDQGPHAELVVAE